MKNSITISALLAFLIVLSGCAGEKPLNGNGPAETSQETTANTGKSDPISISGTSSTFTTDFSKYTVNEEEIMSGGPPKDGIPPLDDPEFITVEEASSWMGAREPLILVEREGTKKAYPLQILMYHEIVNDYIGGMPAAVTYCPLCNSSVVFEAAVDGERLTFGTTGRLRFSNLLMYDRQTESWWQQASGRALIGEHTGTELQIYPSVMLSFEDLRTLHGDALVLSRETGYSRPYGTTPYAEYDTGSPWAYRNGPELSPDKDPMERAVVVRIGNEEKLYTYPEVEERKLITDTVGGREIAVLWDGKPVSALDSREIRSGREVGNVNVFYTRTEAEEVELSFRQGELIDEITGTVWSPSGVGIEGPLRGRQLVPAPAIQHFWFSAYVFSELGL